MTKMATAFLPLLAPRLVPRQPSLSRCKLRCNISSSSSESQSSPPVPTQLDASLPRVNRADAEPTATPSPTYSGGGVRSTTPAFASEEQRLSSVFQTLSKVTLIGRTGALPQIRHFGTSGRCATLRLATNYITRTNDTPTVATQWHYVQVYDSAPGFDIISSIPTGTQLYVEGDLRMTTTEKDGVSRQYTNVLVSKSAGMVRILHRPYSASSQGGYNPSGVNPSGANDGISGRSTASQSSNGNYITDSGLPF